MNQTPRSGEKDLPAQAVEDSIADPNGLGPVRLTTMVVTTCVGAASSRLAGEPRPAGPTRQPSSSAGPICFVGVLVMCLGPWRPAFWPTPSCPLRAAAGCGDARRGGPRSHGAMALV